MFNTKITRNGLTGGKSVNNRNSRLANLVFYIRMVQKYGSYPTLKGFERHAGKKHYDDLFKLARETGVIIETGTKFKGSKVIALGPNADKVNVQTELF